MNALDTFKARKGSGCVDDMDMKVRLLFTADGALLGERIALALQERGAGLSFGLYDEGDLDQRSVSATLVVWTAEARASSDVLLACENAMAERSLVPVGGPGQAPEAFSELTPISLSGWTGEADDPRWRFVLDELALAARRGGTRNGDDSGADGPRDRVANEGRSGADADAGGAAAVAEPAKESFASAHVAEASGVQASRAASSPPARAGGALRSRFAARPNIAALAAGFVASLFVMGGAAFVAGVSAYRAKPALAAVAPAEELADAPASMRTLTAAPSAVDPPPIVAFAEPVGGPAFGRVEAAEDDAPRGGDSETPPADDVIGRLAWASTEVEGEAAGDAAIEAVVGLGAPTVEAAAAALAIAADGAGGVAAPVKLAAAPTVPTDADDPLAATADDVAAGAPVGAFRDCEACPYLVVAPAGAFAIGSPASEAARTYDEYVVSDIEMPAAFAIGAHEVTFGQWDACVADGGCRGYRPSDVGWGRGERPVVNVSFEDAQSYVDWLSRKTGKAYRLPSEAEWEYAARARADGPFGFGRGLSPRKANYHGDYPYDGPKGVYRRKTTPVGAFSANAFGLYDVHGNVWEWTADCWMAGARVADPGPRPVDAGAGGDCAQRVLKGGAWSTGGWRLRAAHREATPLGTRNFSTGFRVVRDAPQG